ncbi:MAG: hypothetical protein K2I22_00625 [Lachnospiraceae bacterium]|nr:hypothetical protein [Lachnospiraceae bacterium]
MRSFIRRYGWNILLFFHIFFISVFSLRIVQLYYGTKQLEIQTVDGLSGYAVSFVVKTNDILDFTFLKEENTEFALMQRLSNRMPVYEVISANHYFEMEEGRAFGEEDFEEGHHTFICGSSAEDILQTDPLEYGGKEYIKIGILADCNTWGSRYEFFLAGDSRYCCQGSGELILETVNSKEAEKLFSRIAEKMEEDGYTIVRLDKKESMIKDIYDMNGIGLKIVVLSMIFLSGSIILFIYFWTGQYEEEQKVYFLLGKRGLYRKICLHFMALLVVGYGAALLFERVKLQGVGIYTFLVLALFILPVLLGCILCRGKEKRNEKSVERDCI